MKNYFNKLWKFRHYIISFPFTLYFNFRFLPIKQAIKLPVLLCSPHIMGNGSYIIEGNVKPGMIRLGFPQVSIYKRKGIVLDNRGLIVFKGKTSIGSDGAFSVGESGKITIGKNFVATYGNKIVCYNKIDIKDNVLIGWGTILCDTDFHSLKSWDGATHKKGFGAICINNDVWVGPFVKIYKNSEIPSFCTVAANTFINKKIECEPYSLIYPGVEIKIKTTGYYRDINDDKITY